MHHRSGRTLRDASARDLAILALGVALVVLGVALSMSSTGSRGAAAVNGAGAPASVAVAAALHAPRGDGRQ
jgi:hypothetical protein